jgi:hypothetical protein
MHMTDVMRATHKELNDRQAQDIAELKLMGEVFVEKCALLGTSRELSLAITNAEQAVMWAVKHVTK